MKNEPIFYKRLGQLAKHLDKCGKEKPRKADVPLDIPSIIETEDTDYFAVFLWALDELPEVFPAYFPQSDRDYPIQASMDHMNKVAVFFGITPHEFLHLFSPRCQTINKYGGQVLEFNATEAQVSQNIRAFLQTNLTHN